MNLNAVNYGTAGDKETGWLINFISALASRKCSDLQNHFRNILEALTLLTTLPTSVSPPLGCDAFIFDTIPFLFVFLLALFVGQV